MIVLAGAALASAPRLARAQADTTAAVLESGDVVRVRGVGTGADAEEYRFRAWKGDSLVLAESRHGRLESLPRTRIAQLEVWRETGGTHFWDGVLVGGGAGLAADLITTGILCAGDDAGGTVYVPVPCVVLVPVVYLPVTVLPGAAVGGLAGLMARRHEWVSVEFGPPATSEGTGAEIGGGRPGPGLSVQLELHPPWPP